MESILFWKNYFMLLKRLHLKPGPRPWTRTLKNLDPEKSGPWKSLTWKTMTQKKLDPEKSGPEKPGPWKIWILKNLGYEKRRKQLDAEKQIRRPHGIIYWILKSAKKRLVSQSNSEGFLISVWFVLFHHTFSKESLEVDLKWNLLKWNWLLFKNSFHWSKGLLHQKGKNSLSDLSHDVRKFFSANESYYFFFFIKDLNPVAVTHAFL